MPPAVEARSLNRWTAREAPMPLSSYYDIGHLSVLICKMEIIIVPMS